MDLLAELTGNRVNYGINSIGGVRRDITEEQKKDILKAMTKLEDATRYYIEVATQETTLIERLSKVGFLSTEDAHHLGAVGPTGRASNVNKDIRRDDPYAAYGDMSFKVITDNHCDVYGRTLVRVGELMESYNMIKFLVNNIPDGPIAIKSPRKMPIGEALSRYEAPRGEDIHYVKSNGTDKPERVKVRAPTLANVQAVATMLDKGYLADVPIVIAAIDPCFSCTDRTTIAVKDSDNGKERGIIEWKDLRDYSIKWYKENRGLDCSTVKLKISNK
jgi:membrane-bound hydrogenase subunit alpha